MSRKFAKRQQLRRKWRRHTAALMGTAIIAGAALTSMPAPKAFAAETIPNPLSVKTVQAQDVGAQRPPGRGWHEHKDGSWPGPNENQGWYQDGKIYYRNDNPQNYWDTNRYIYGSNPVDYLKDTAAKYGFNASSDTFTLLTINNWRALIEVRKADTGQLYNVLLEQNDDNWTVVSVRAI